MAVVVTVKSGFDLGYVWAAQGGAGPGQERQASGGYYIDAAQAGEPPGRWWGPGVGHLGQVQGAEVDRVAYDAIYSQVDPVTGQHLGRKPANYGVGQEDEGRYAARLAELVALEQVTPDARRLGQLKRDAAKSVRSTPAYTDLTVSFSKSISVFHASIRENERRARLAGNTEEAARWQAENLALEAILQDANRAALAYVQEHAGYTRTGYHGAKVNGREPGKYEGADLVVSSWLQGTSRDGDPQDHVHNQIARIVRTRRDGKWRALDTTSLRNVLPAAQPIAAAYVECALSARYGFTWTARRDGKGNEITGVSQPEMDAYSQRRETIRANMPAAVEQWTRRYGRPPTEREVLFIKNGVWDATRNAKPEEAIDWDALCSKWDAQMGGELADLASRVSRLRQDGTQEETQTQDGGGGEGPTREAQTRAVQMALAAMQSAQSTWTRAELMKQIGYHLPAESRSMAPAAAVALLDRLADEAVSGSIEQVACLESPEWPPVPAYLRRAEDGRSVYVRPHITRYATRVQLTTEEQLLHHAQRSGGAHLSRADAARVLGATAEELEARLYQRAQVARDAGNLESGLRIDQAAALFHVLTSERTAEVIVGPAGSGKSHTMGFAAGAWTEITGADVLGLATSQAGRNVLAGMGVTHAENTAEFLGHLREGRGIRGIRTELKPGSLVMIDEASMTSMSDFVDIVTWAASNGHKVVITGDQEQLAAVENGGGMMLLARRMGHVQLAEAVRFKAAWEQDASLRLRVGDVSALEEYDGHGRVSGDTPEQAMERARKEYVAEILSGHDTLLITRERARAAEMSRRIRDDLMHLGIVDDGPEVHLYEGVRASVGDIVICRDNDHPRGIANGDALRVESIGPEGITVRKVTDSDKETGARRFEGEPIVTDQYSSWDLGYAITGHTSQGRTVHTGIAVVTGSEPRNWFYVAMTRGRESNRAIAFTRTVNVSDAVPGSRPAPEIERHRQTERERAGEPVKRSKDKGKPAPREAIVILTEVVERSATEESALEVRRANRSNEDHLAKLNTEWMGETDRARDRHYRQIVEAAVGQEDGFKWGYTATWLCRTLRAAELAGRDPAEIIGQATAGRGFGGVRDIVSVLDNRIRAKTEHLVPLPQRPWSARVPVMGSPEEQEHANNLAGAMDARKVRIGEHAAETSPTWAVNALGEVPAEESEREIWARRASEIGAYRELYSYSHPTAPVGPEPAGDSPEKRAAWRSAINAMTQVDGVKLDGLTDHSLELMRSTYKSETAWAPRYVAPELRDMRAGAQGATTEAIRADAEAELARREGDAERAARHEDMAASSRAMAEQYTGRAGKLAGIMEDWHAWDASTEGSRHLAVAADGEWRRRHPGEALEPLASAEPEAPTEEERGELLAVAEGLADPAWLEDAERARAAFAEMMAERAATVVPAEDDEMEDEGLAWPGRQAIARDAILQAPKPEIRPAPEVEAAAAAPEPEREGGE